MKQYIEVHLYGELRSFSDNEDPRKSSIVEKQIDEGDTINDVLEDIGVPLDKVGTNIFLNGEYSKLSREVKNGDRLGVFPQDMNLLYKWYFEKKGG